MAPLVGGSALNTEAGCLFQCCTDGCDGLCCSGPSCSAESGVGSSAIGVTSCLAAWYSAFLLSCCLQHVAGQDGVVQARVGVAVPLLLLLLLLWCVCAASASCQLLHECDVRTRGCCCCCLCRCLVACAGRDGPKQGCGRYSSWARLSVPPTLPSTRTHNTINTSQTRTHRFSHPRGCGPSSSGSMSLSCPSSACMVSNAAAPASATRRCRLGRCQRRRVVG